MGAEFVILGSLTKIGSQVSIDTTLINTREQVPLQRFYSAAESVAGIPAKINELARTLYFKILGREVISKIVISGNKYIEQDAIMLSIATKPGDVVKVKDVEQAVVRGVPFVEIIRTAKEKNADMIVIGTHGRTGIDHMLFGSTAEKVVRKSPCPVLTVRMAGKEFKMP